MEGDDLQRAFDKLYEYAQDIAVRHGFKSLSLFLNGENISKHYRKLRKVMAIHSRTWQFGTRKHVVVRDIVRYGGHAALLVDDSPENPKPEGYILLATRDQFYNVKLDQVGTITFIEGGPTGGHWVFERDSASGQVKKEE